MTDHSNIPPEQMTAHDGVTVGAFFTVPHYKVRWSDGFFLTVAVDDLQAVIRSIIRSYPERKITLEPESPVGNQIASNG